MYWTDAHSVVGAGLSMLKHTPTLSRSGTVVSGGSFCDLQTVPYKLFIIDMEEKMAAHGQRLNRWPSFSMLEPEFLASIKMACVFGGAGNEAIVVTVEDEVFSLGSNCSGCLGEPIQASDSCRSKGWCHALSDHVFEAAL